MNDSLLNLTDKLLIRDNKRLDEINERIMSRRFPDVELKPNLSVRPVGTQCTHYPIIDHRKNDIMSKEYLEHYVETNFAPCHAKAPVKNCKKHFEIENELRGQNTPLHKGDLGLKYIPHLESDMYKVQIPEPSLVVAQPHPLLFSVNQFETNSNVGYINNNIGRETFNNSTRTQLRQNH